MQDDSQTIANRQLGAFANVDNTDANDFIERLDEMHSLDVFRAYKRRTFEEMRLSPGAHIADVGCGTGEDISILAGLVGASGSAVGIDLSEAMVAEARKRHSGVPGLSFAQAPSDRLGLADDSLDAIRADRVLIHVPEPEATLAEFIRVTKPGGRIVISEPDMHGFWLASDDYGATRILMTEIANSCITPYLPRDLWTMFRDAGLKDVQCTVQTLTSSDIAAVAKVLDFSIVLKMAVARELLTEERAARWMEDMQRRSASDRFAAGLSIMIVSGTKA